MVLCLYSGLCIPQLSTGELYSCEESLGWQCGNLCPGCAARWPRSQRLISRTHFGIIVARISPQMNGFAGGTHGAVRRSRSVLNQPPRPPVATLTAFVLGAILLPAAALAGGKPHGGGDPH